MSSRNTEQQAGVRRDSLGRFQKGSTGNREGRKPGATCNALRKAREAAESVALPVLIEAAKGGSLDAAKAICGFGLPRQKAVTMPEELPGDIPGLLEAMNRGEVSPDTVQGVLAAHETAKRIQSLDDLEARISALEGRTRG